MTDAPQPEKVRKRAGRPKGMPNLDRRAVAARVGAIMQERSLPMLQALAIVVQDESAPVEERMIAADQVGLHMRAYVAHRPAIDT